jgi:hypothetical protein
LSIGGSGLSVDPNDLHLCHINTRAGVARSYEVN